MIDIYKDEAQGAIHIEALQGVVPNLWYLHAELVEMADKIARLMDGGWYLEAPMQGGYGLIRKGVTMAHAAEETE